jgi:hypothetical protein
VAVADVRRPQLGNRHAAGRAGPSALRLVGTDHGGPRGRLGPARGAWLPSSCTTRVRTTALGDSANALTPQVWALRDGAELLVVGGSHKSSLRPPNPETAETLGATDGPTRLPPGVRETHVIPFRSWQRLVFVAVLRLRAGDCVLAAATTLVAALPPKVEEKEEEEALVPHQRLSRRPLSLPPPPLSATSHMYTLPRRAVLRYRGAGARAAAGGWRPETGQFHASPLGSIHELQPQKFCTGSRCLGSGLRSVVGVAGWRRHSGRRGRRGDRAVHGLRGRGASRGRKGGGL